MQRPPARGTRTTVLDKLLTTPHTSVTGSVGVDGRRGIKHHVLALWPHPDGETRVDGIEPSGTFQIILNDRIGIFIFLQ